MYLSRLQNLFDLSNNNLMNAFPPDKSQPLPEINLMRHITSICQNLQMYLSKLSNVYIPITKYIWPFKWQLNEWISCWQKSTLARNEFDETHNISKCICLTCQMYLSQLQNIFDLSNDNLMKAVPADKSQPWPGIRLMRHITSEKNGTAVTMRKRLFPDQQKY